MNLPELQLLPDEDYKQRWAGIKIIIDQRGISQKLLASRTGIEAGTLNKYINGKLRCNRIDKLAAVSEELGLSLWYWFKFDPDKQISNNIVMLPVYYGFTAKHREVAMEYMPASPDDYNLGVAIRENRVFWVKLLSDKFAPIAPRNSRCLIVHERPSELIADKLYLVLINDQDILKRYVPHRSNQLFVGVLAGDNMVMNITEQEIIQKNIEFYRIAHIGFEP